MMYILNLHSALCHLYLNKTGRDKQKSRVKMRLNSRISDPNFRTLSSTGGVTQSVINQLCDLQHCVSVSFLIK